jgi:hypothetical protein
MNKNSLLNIANFFCNFFKLLIGILIITITIGFIHFQFDSNYYNEWSMEKPENDSVIRFEKESFVAHKPTDSQNLRLTDWKTSSLYFNYFKFISILIFIYLSINQFKKVLKSVSKLETFQRTNVRAFRKIGYYCLLIAGLSFFSYLEFNYYSKNSISIPLNILLIALLAFILAEIFKEGNNLMEENQLTV